jgi:hypothetical protein
VFILHSETVYNLAPEDYTLWMFVVQINEGCDKSHRRWCIIEDTIKNDFEKALKP